MHQLKIFCTVVAIEFIERLLLFSQKLNFFCVMEINFTSAAEDAYRVFIGVTNFGVIPSSSLSSFCQNRGIFSHSCRYMNTTKVKWWLQGHFQGSRKIPVKKNVSKILELEVSNFLKFIRNNFEYNTVGLTRIKEFS